MSELGASGPVLSRALVGRDDELSVLRDAWRRAGTVSVVRGAAGIGKSRLVRELASWAHAQGGRVVVGRCSSISRESPLRPVREALLAVARTGFRPGEALSPFVPALARVVPEWGDAAAVAPDSLLVLGEGVLRLLASGASPGQSTILVIEDVQWADRETLAVLEYLADNVVTTPVLVVLTLRDGEPGEGLDLVEMLLRRRVATEVALDPLSSDEVLELARSCLGEVELQRDAADALISRSEGIPFIVEELLAAAARSGWDSIAARQPVGPGWALVGDAGYHKDPITAQGMLDAFRDAELLAEAVDRGLDDDLGSELRRYHEARDAAAMPMYDFTCGLAHVEQPPPPEMQALIADVAGNPVQTSRFLGLSAGSVSLAEFFSPASVARIATEAVRPAA